MKLVLIIGHTPPEPNHTAAGRRMLELIELFKALGFSVQFCAMQLPKSPNIFTSLEVNFDKIELNSDSFNDYVASLNPAIVVFDRFMTEEQFGWRVRETCPTALRILDTEDLHFLRKTRAQAVKENTSKAVLDFSSDITFREIAAMYRCDVSLIISEFEMQLLKKHFGFPEKLLHYLPFLIDSESILLPSQLPNFEERSDLVFIGNYMHKPNVDAVLRLKKVIWPKLKDLLPEANLCIYGAYTPQVIEQLDNPRERFLVKGYTSDAHQMFLNAKLLVAPLRFGAGLKGKIVDAWQAGTPVITTQIGAEGIADSASFGGDITNSEQDFIKLASLLYLNQNNWSLAQKKGVEVVKNRFNRDNFKVGFSDRIKTLLQGLSQHRDANFTGQMLWHHSLQSSKYLSKWIQEKNKFNEPPAS